MFEKRGEGKRESGGLNRLERVGVMTLEESIEDGFTLFIDGENFDRWVDEYLAIDSFERVRIGDYVTNFGKVKVTFERVRDRGTKEAQREEPR